MSLRGHEVHIICFYPQGAFESELQNTEVCVHHLNKKGRWDIFHFLWRLRRILVGIQPDILHGYLVIPNILSVIMRYSLQKTKIVWGVRSSSKDLTRFDRIARWSYRIESYLSQYSDLVIANSYAGKKYAISLGFPENKLAVVSNGIDTELFKPDLLVRERVRQSWGVTDDTLIIGTVARLDPAKGYELMLQAASLFVEKHENVLFVCVGYGKKDYSAFLRKFCSDLGLDGNFKWFGADLETRDVYNGFDMLVSTSRTEGFSNVIGEAMSCGLPCVVTDVGDSAFIVGELGEVVSPANPENLVSAWERCLSRHVELSRGAIRHEMNSRFSVDVLVSNTEVQLQSILSR